MRIFTKHTYFAVALLFISLPAVALETSTKAPQYEKLQNLHDLEKFETKLKQRRDALVANIATLKSQLAAMKAALNTCSSGTKLHSPNNGSGADSNKCISLPPPPPPVTVIVTVPFS